MNRKRLLYQLFPSYLSIIIIAVFALIWFTNTSLQSFYYKEKSNDLEARAILVGQKILADSTLEIGHLREICQNLSKVSGTRITIISPTGKVLSDSEEDPEIMDNHSDRPEVRTAHRGEVGASVRYSHTLDQEMMYLAIPIKLHEDSLIVRTSLPVTSLQETIWLMRWKIILGGIVIVLLASVVNFAVARRIVRPMEEMKQGAERFARGELDHKLPIPDTEEVASLASSLNHMAGQLDGRIKTILRQRNEQDAILASMVEGVLAIDSDERVINLNGAAARLLEIDQSMAVGKTVQALVRNTELYRFIRSILSGDKNLETEIILPDPTDRYLKVRGTMLQGADGGQIGVLIVLNDITEIRRLENVRSEFVANVSHELKTPITSIKGYVETLRDSIEDTPGESAKFLDVVARQADRLNAIIDDLLELARIEQAKEALDFAVQMVPVKGVLEAAVQDCQSQAEQKGIVVHLDCDEKLTAPLKASLMRRAVVNLIDNAIKYSESGLAVNVTGKKTRGSVTIAVQDFGVGIARKHFDRLFERFYRVDKARSRKLGGTGLGLAIVKHITQGHGGSVAVNSEPGQGSTFSIKLPAKLT